MRLARDRVRPILGALTAAIAASVIACAPAAIRRSESAPAIESAPEGRRIALLGGHVTIPLPLEWSGEVADGRVAGAVVESSVPLEAPSSDAPFASPRFRLTISELHVLTSGDVMTDAREVFRDDWELDPRPDPSGRIAWVLADQRPWNGEVPFAVLGALVVHEIAPSSA